MSSRHVGLERGVGDLVVIKKSDLYRSLWSSCDELRGGMDASQYKDYVLTLLFMKYVSDKYAGKADALIEIPEGGAFSDLLALKGDKEIGDKVNKVIAKLAEANDLRGVIDVADFNDEEKLGKGKEMQDRLSKLVAIFDSLDFRASRAEGDDLLGDAYEYLMRHFAAESGKSKGQFYTPAEVSRIMAKVVGIGHDTRQDQTIYDPTCGSGSLLLKAADEAPRGVTIYGQEMDNATWALARMNMFLHGQPTHDLRRGNTLAAPQLKNSDGTLKMFDFAVANPPFSTKAWSSGLVPEHDEFGRFDYGVPPAKNGDYAFLLHVVKSLKSSGKAAVILPHGVLFRGQREAVIRKNLIKRGLIKSVIGLPPNLFYGTAITACVVVIDKEKAQARTGIFMIDASKGFRKDGNKNRLRAQDIHKIVDVFNTQKEEPGYSRQVPISEIASPANDFNLNIPRYIDSSEPEDLHDLDAHLRGGIPDSDIDALSEYWNVFQSLRLDLFEPSDRTGYSHPKVDSHQVKATILAQEDFSTYASDVAAIFEAWKSSHVSTLNGLAKGSAPKEIIVRLSEDVLERFADLPLLSKYLVYQRVMDYWAEVMQDDLYLIAADGWIEAAKPRSAIEDKDRSLKETPDLTLGRKKFKTDLIPPALVAARYFVTDMAGIESMELERDLAARELESFLDEHSVEDDPIEDSKNDSGKITKTGVKAQLATYRQLPESDDDQKLLTRCLELIDAEAASKKAVKAARASLDEKVHATYEELTEAEIKDLVINDKWFASLKDAITGEVQRRTDELARRVKTLEERYAVSLPELGRQVDELATKVEAHLKTMGI
jgi:type I restriction enzyme M protein